MVKPDFMQNPIYIIRILDDKNNLLHKGFMNTKAWSKTLETGELWEYIAENGRVIGKDFYPFVIDFDNIRVNNDTLDFFLVLNTYDEESSVNNIELNDSVLLDLEKIILKRKQEMPPNSYTTNLFEKGEEKILKKLGEETIELILASKEYEDDVVYETADLIYHIMVLFAYKNISFKDVLKELKSRMDK